MEPSAMDLDAKREMFSEAVLVENWTKTIESYITALQGSLEEIYRLQKALHQSASALRSMLSRELVKAENHHRLASQKRKGRKPALGRKILRRALPRASRSRKQGSKMGKGKRLAPKLAQHKGR